MKNLLNKIRKNNKGFTLVELIIVVAILAVLMAVLAPQYIRYVEKSRQTTDAATLNEVKHAVEVEAALTEGAGGTFAIDGANGTITNSLTPAGTLDTAVNTTLGLPASGAKISLKSAAGKANATYTLTVNADGTASWDATSAELIEKLTAGTAPTTASED